MHEILKRTISYEIQEKKLVYELFMRKCEKGKGKEYIIHCKESMCGNKIFCERMCQLMGRKHEVNNLDLWLSFVYPSAAALVRLIEF